MIYETNIHQAIYNKLEEYEDKNGVEIKELIN